MSEPLLFHAEDSFTIKGRGRVFTGHAPEDATTESGHDWIGREALIDGVSYRIKGVETFLLPRNIAKGDKIGLLVDE